MKLELFFVAFQKFSNVAKILFTNRDSTSLNDRYGVQRCWGAEMLESWDVKMQKCRNAEMQRSRDPEVQRCRGGEMQRCRGCVNCVSN